MYRHPRDFLGGLILLPGRDRRLDRLALALEMTYVDLHARALTKAGWSLGFSSYVDRDGRKMVVADAHKGRSCGWSCMRNVWRLRCSN
jgi:hypothetical protein